MSDFLARPDRDVFLHFLDDLASLGVRRVDEGGRDFAVFKARSNARWWLVPRDDRRAAAAGLEMLQPVSARAALSKTAARIVARTSPRHLPGGMHLRLDGAPDLGGAFADKVESFAYFTGTDGPHRKTAIQIMGPRGRILGYAKLSRVPRIMRFVAAEADMLAQVDRLGLRSADVPQVMATRRDTTLALLVTDSLKAARHSIKKRPGPEHRAFLDEIASRTGGVGAGEAFDKLARETAALQGQLSADWLRRFQAGLDRLRAGQTRLPVALAHGDFTPWNAFVQSGRLYVFDWEYAHHGYPLGYDQMHFLLSTVQKDRASAQEIVRRIVAELARDRFADDHAIAGDAALFSLLLHATFYFGRALEAGESTPGFESQDLRGALIDVLLDRSALP